MEKPKDEDNILSGKAYFQTRLAAVAELKKSTDNHPYPHKFDVSLTLDEFVNKYSYLQNEETLENSQESVAGRVHSIRGTGSKLTFIDLRGDGFKLQIKVSAKSYESLESYVADMKTIQRGDIIGAIGLPGRTKRGELSIIAKKVIPLIHFMEIISVPHRVVSPLFLLLMPINQFYRRKFSLRAYTCYRLFILVSKIRRQDIDKNI